MKPLSLLAALVLPGVLVALARGDEPDPKSIIARADRTAKAVRKVSYKAEAWAEGSMKDQVPRFRATVFAELVPDAQNPGAGATRPHLRIEGLKKAPDSEKARRVEVVLDGQRAISIDHDEKAYTVGKWPEQSELIREVWKLCLMQEYLHPTPFSDELNADSYKYEGKKTIGDIPCHVIYVVYAGGRAETRWYFGVNDYLPHRADRVLKGDQGQGVVVLELSEINTAPLFGADTFAIRIPEGYQEKKYQPPLRSDPKLLAVGSPAPDWTLKTPDGKTVALSKLRGKVVVLDFWATWCRPCVQAMPGVQKLHEKFKNKPVVVFGVDTWESGDPVAFMKERKYTYGLLLKGDEIAKAYRLRGIPAFYVIAPDGKIAYASTGYDPSKEEPLAKLIETILEGSE